MLSIVDIVGIVLVTILVGVFISASKSDHDADWWCVFVIALVVKTYAVIAYGLF